MKNWPIYLLLTVVIVLAFAPAAHPVDIEGRAQALRALQSSAVLKTSATGSGVCGAVVAGQGVVLTAFHCVKDSIESSSRPLFVELYVGGTFRGAISTTWPTVDLALVVHERAGGRVLDMAPDVAAGETAWTVGSPDREKFIVQRGVVSRVFRDKFTNCPRTLIIGTDVHQILAIGAMTWFGNSGGGVFNADGQLVGIMVRLHFTGEAVDCKPSDLGQALWGYAVGIDTIREKVR